MTTHRHPHHHRGRAAGGPGRLAELGPADRARLAGWLDLAARGWHLFPVHPDRKQPAITRWQDRASTDPDRITRFFTTHPDHNASIACGPSRLLVLDCDTPKPGRPERSAGDTAADGWAVLTALAAGRGGLPDTFTVTTPSGGRHLYFRAPTPAPGQPPQGNTAKALGPMLDTRGAGGQVLAPGSRLPHGGYALLDDTDPAALPWWIAARLAASVPAAIPTPPERPVVPPRDRDAYICAIVRAELGRVTQARRGGHNTAVFTAARALGQLAAAGALNRTTAEADLTRAAAHIITGPCGCTTHDITATITSGLNHGARRPRQLPQRQVAS